MCQSDEYNFVHNLVSQGFNIHKIANSSQNQYMKITKTLIKGWILLFFCWTASGFYLQFSGEGHKKCYRAEHSPDKTLQAKLGILRFDQKPCLVKFDVTLKTSEGVVLQHIFSLQQPCQNSRFKQSSVVKHTSRQENEQYLAGYYHICAEIIQNQNNELLLEIFIGQKLNPAIYEYAQNSIPLIMTQELVDLDYAVNGIKRGLAKSQAHAKMIRERGNSLDQKIETMMNLNTWMSLMQIGALIVFAFAWILIVRQMKFKK